MLRSIECDNCGGVFQMLDSQACEKGHCDGCGEPLVIPEGPGMVLESDSPSDADVLRISPEPLTARCFSSAGRIALVIGPTVVFLGLFASTSRQTSSHLRILSVYDFVFRSRQVARSNSAADCWTCMRLSFRSRGILPPSQEIVSVNAE